MNTKTKQLACALAGAPLPKPWWKTVEVDYYFDWLSWGIVVEVRHGQPAAMRLVRWGWNGFMFQIGPWGMAFRWPKTQGILSEGFAREAMSEGEVAGGVDMRAAGFKAPPQHMTSTQAALSARTRSKP